MERKDYRAYLQMSISTLVARTDGLQLKPKKMDENWAKAMRKVDAILKKWFDWLIVLGVDWYLNWTGFDPYKEIGLASYRGSPMSFLA